MCAHGRPAVAVFAVALAELAGTVDAEAAALAADLGTSAYDARLLLAAGLPALVRTTPDRAQALDLLARLRGRGHRAVACDAAAVVSSGAMVAMRRFRLEDGAVALDGDEAALPYGDIVALIAAVHRRRTDTESRTQESKFSMSRALLTSGLSMTKTVTTRAHTSSEEREGVLYAFRRSGATPWILREHGTAWGSLGPAVAATESENFRRAVTALRERAPGAAFDERLVTRKASGRAAVSGGAGATTVTTSSDAAIDLLAHLLALWLARAAPR